MRTRVAVLVLVLAAALGVVMGGTLLPDRGRRTADRAEPSSTTVGSAGGPSSAPGSATPGSPTSLSPSPSATPSPASSPPTGSGGAGPVTEEDLLTAQDLTEVGLVVRERPSAGARLELTACTAGRYTRTTLAETATSGPAVQRLWEGETIAASQEAVSLNVAEDAEAADVARRVLRLLETCQRQPPRSWVYGPTHTDRLGPRITASWLGQVDGSRNTTGRAPEDAGISGGVAVLRNGDRVAVVQLSLCAGAGESLPCTVAPADPGEQLAALSRAAARRLG